MKTIQTYTMEQTGTNYEIGYAHGKMVAQFPHLKALHIQGFDASDAAEAAQLFDRWCPGLTEELNGFADALSIPPEQVFFTAMTYLQPRCSQIALLPSRTAEGKPLVARSYEFSHDAEDFTLVKTAVKGKYTHMGTSVISFGRDDGLNEHGLSVTQSSCGFPVGAPSFMRSPAHKGLQFWVVIRSLLENCKDVNEALAWLEGMPIAYNLNLILADKTGNAALYETLDGRTACKKIGPDTEEQMLFATNHAILPELIPFEFARMIHSVKRYEFIERELRGKARIRCETLKEMLLAMYPDGLCCHFFEAYFGTTKSMIISPADGTIELCWGGRRENGWHTYKVVQPLVNGTQPAAIILDKTQPDIFNFQNR